MTSWGTNSFLFHIRTDSNSLRYNFALEKKNLASSIKAINVQANFVSSRPYQEKQKATQSTIKSKDVRKFGLLLEDGKLQFEHYQESTAIDILQKYCSCSGKKKVSKAEICLCIESDLKGCDVCNCNNSDDNNLEINE